MDRELAKENKLIFVFAVVATAWLLSICDTAEADIMSLFRPSIGGKVCKITDPDLRRSPIGHLEEGLRLASLDSFCEAAKNFRRAYIDAMDPETKNHAWFAQAETAFYMADFETLFERGEAYLKMNDNRTYRINPDDRIRDRSERLQYLLIKGTLELHQELGKKSPYSSRLLGTEMEHKQEGSTKIFYSIPEFMQRWPSSKHMEEMKDLLQILRDGVSGNILVEGRRLWAQRQYVPAIARMKFVVSQGAYLKEFDVALFELIRITEEFSIVVLNEAKVPTSTLATWMEMKQDEITPDSREHLSATLKSEAKKMKQLMRSKLPNSPWTKKLY
jgi:hypothetical protein